MAGIVDSLVDRARLTGNALEKWACVRGLRSVRGLPLPDFLGIGAQKAGTTWVDRNLRCHPELYLPPDKELHYFDRYYERSLRSYARHFKAGAGRVRGEITPSYSVLPRERIRLIRAIMPDVRLVLLLRNPIERAWSHALMRLVRRRKRSFEEVSERELVEHLGSPGCRKKGDYLSILENWLAFFPEEQLFLGFTEDLSARPKEFLCDLFDFLGVSPDIDWGALPYNRVISKGISIDMPSKYRDLLEEMYCPEVERLYTRFGDRIAGWRCDRSAGSTAHRVEAAFSRYP